jgi:hypothetical protein
MCMYLQYDERQCIYVYVCMCMRVCICNMTEDYVCMCMYVCACVCIYNITKDYVCVCMHVYVCMYLQYYGKLWDVLQTFWIGFSAHSINTWTKIKFPKQKIRRKREFVLLQHANLFRCNMQVSRLVSLIVCVKVLECFCAIPMSRVWRFVCKKHKM